MAIFPRAVSPRAAWRDLRTAIAQPRKHRIVFAALSLALPAGIFLAMFNQAKVDEEWIPPKITYIRQWSADRSIAEVRAQQAVDLPKELAAKKAREDAAEARRQSYRRVADEFGIEVDKVRR